jgi:hypothetical protein
VAKNKAPSGAVMGRPTECTPEATTKIVNAVRSGLPIELASDLGGVSRQTVLEWVRRGEGREDADRPPDPVYVDFANQYRKARAEFAAFLMQPCIEVVRGSRASKRKKGADGKPVMVKALGATTRANEAHWHLARRFPEHWGQGRETAVAVEMAGAVAAEPSGPRIIVKYAQGPEAVIVEPAEPSA